MDSRSAVDTTSCAVQRVGEKLNALGGMRSRRLSFVRIYRNRERRRVKALVTQSHSGYPISWPSRMIDESGHSVKQKTYT